MFNFIKNKFLFIIAISILTLIVLIALAVTLYKDESTSFSDGGYIISTTTKKNAKYYFSANTKYKDNADNKVTFKNNKSKKVAVDPASFVHYDNGSIVFLQKGALLNLNEINSSIVSYYNVTRDNIIKKNSNNYSVSSNGEDISLNSFIGRISDNKYIVAGSNLSLEVPGENDKITGDYFEVTYIKDGIVKIDNKNVSYQVTAQNSFINVGNSIRINLGNEKIYYDGSAKMLLSQITINGDENINLDVNKKDSKKDEENGTGEGNGEGEGAGGSGEGEGNGDESTTTTSTTDNGEVDSTTENSNGDDTNGGGSGNGTAVDKSVKIELINADVTSTSIKAVFQLNNASAVSGKLIATLTNIRNNEQEEPVNISAVNGSFTIDKKALYPDTEYNLTIIERGKDSQKQYFQKTFKTNDLGITLEKQYVTDSSLSYNVLFDQNSEVDKVKVSIYDNTGLNEDISPNEFLISKGDVSSLVEFTSLKSNSSYSVSIDTIWIDNVAYQDLYTISRIDTTLKKTPIISDIKIVANTDEVKFNIKANNINDPDEGIISYVYKIYKSDSINIDGTDPELVYTITKNDPDPIDLDLTKIDSMKTGVNYRCKIVAQYDDNEMIRESESDYSGNFLIKSKPNIVWESTSTTADEIKGKLTLVDASCSIPIRGRSCLGLSNDLILRYYKVGDTENNSQEVALTFDPKTLVADVDINKDLSSSTAYIFKFYANYYDDNNVLHNNVQIGDPFYVTTDVSTKVKFKVKKDNESGKDPAGAEIVTFDASLIKPKDSDVDEDTASIKLNLYSGSYNVSDKLIGTYTITDRNLIEDFYNNFTITNVLFENENEGKLDSLQKMIKVTRNNSQSLNRTYTVEIAEIMSQNGSTDSIEVEDKVYTFKLTSSYYLDSRIASKPNFKYVTVTDITKGDLTEDEYNTLSRTVTNLDSLSDDTVVGITIDNKLPDDFVDSAFTDYEKVTVDYVVYNTVNNKEIKRISISMDNKYQPGSQTIFLDPTELDDGENFTRGYNYKIGYELKFVTEDGSNPTYTNDKLYEKKDISKEYPTVKQFISNSNSNSVTYKYSISDVDNALSDKKLFYKVANADNYQSSSNPMVVDNNYHDISISLSDKKDYSVYMKIKNTDGKTKYVPFANYRFEGSYEYLDNNLYSLVDDKDNTLKIKFVNDEFIDRAVAFRVKIKAVDASDIEEFDKVFLASKLDVEEVGDEENKETIKYIAIDYAYINRFLKHDLEVEVIEYYDSGLVGYNHSFDDGFVLEKYSSGSSKYLNVYNDSNLNVSSSAEEDNINSILMYKTRFHFGDEKMSLYNYFDRVSKDAYNKFVGIYTFNSVPDDNKLGLVFDVSLPNNELVKASNTLKSGGILLGDKYIGYNPKMIKKTTINASNNTYRFNDIVPSVTLKNSESTINSIKFKVSTSGIYGQFMRNNTVHNVFYIDVYNDAELSHKLTTLTSNVNLSGSNITSEVVEYKNLKPNTAYYATVSAYIDNKLVRLYDIDSGNGKNYFTKVYELKTLDASKIFQKFTYEVKPVDYDGASSKKEVKWRLDLANTENYKIRIELFDQQNNPKRFDGGNAVNCDINSFGSAEDSFFNGCYIQVPKDVVNGVNSATGKKFANNNNYYYFSGDDFVFGKGKVDENGASVANYKVIIYAVPYTNNKYVENDKIILYQSDSLETVNSGSAKIVNDYLKTANFKIDELNTGVRCVTKKDNDGNVIKDDNGLFTCLSNNDNETFIDVKIFPTDVDKVIKYGKYSILLNSNGTIVQAKTDISVNALNKTYTFVNLEKNKRYSVSIFYETYLNNANLDEDAKDDIPQITHNVLTPVSEGVTPGRITASKGNSNKSIVLTYAGFNEIEKINRMVYTISLNSGSADDKISGEYILSGTDSNNYFAFDGNIKSTAKIVIDFSEQDNFTLQSGQSYLINTDYYSSSGKIDDPFGFFSVDLNL